MCSFLDDMFALPPFPLRDNFFVFFCGLMLDEIEESYARAQDAICGLSLIAHWYLGVIIVGVRMGEGRN